MNRIALAVAALAVGLAPVSAQTPAPAPPPQGQTFTLEASLNRMYDSIKRNLIEAAEKMPEAEFAFKPTPEVRSFGEILAHVANAHYSYCSIANGEANPNKENLEKTKLNKTAIVAALKASIDYCDGVYGGVTEESVLQMVKQGPNQVTRASVLATNASHDNEHYGNLVTYMRLKGLVPPSTERAQQQRRSE